MSVLHLLGELVQSVFPGRISLGSLKLANRFVGEHTVVRLCEFTRRCGHAGFVVEIRGRSEREPLLAILDEWKMNDVCELLQQCIAAAEERHRSET